MHSFRVMLTLTNLIRILEMNRISMMKGLRNIYDIHVFICSYY